MRGADSERFWDHRAQENALFYVDNELDYETPDSAVFWQRGPRIVDVMVNSVGLKLSKNDTVVDVGCGVGRLTRTLAERTRWVFGLDVSQKMLDLARNYNPHVRNVEWLHGDGTSLRGLGDGVCDGCFSHVVFQHIPEPEITLNYVREMGRVLRPGGWALFQVSTDPTVHGPSRHERDGGRFGLRTSWRHRSDRAWWGSAIDIGDLQIAAEGARLEIEQLLDAGSQFTTVLARRAAATSR